MGTRALTYLYEKNETKPFFCMYSHEKNETKPFFCMYSQYDGHPSSHGMKLAKFLTTHTLVNGFQLSETGEHFANGMPCLAGLMVCAFKQGKIGGFYLMAPDIKDADQDYEYHIYEGKVVVKDNSSTIFIGTWKAFFDFCAIN